MKCEQPGPGGEPSALTQLGESSTYLKTPPHSYSDPALLWAPSFLDLCLSGNTQVSFMLHMRPSQVQRILVFKLRQSSDQWLRVHQAPSSCLPPCLPRCVSPGTVLCLVGSVPERRKYSRRYPKHRSIALYLEVDAEMKCNIFTGSFPSTIWKCLFPPDCLSFWDSGLRTSWHSWSWCQGFALVRFGCDCGALCCSSPFLTFAVSEKKRRAIQRRT